MTPRNELTIQILTSLLSPTSLELEQQRLESVFRNELSKQQNSKQDYQLYLDLIRQLTTTTVPISLGQNSDSESFINLKNAVQASPFLKVKEDNSIEIVDEYLETVSEILALASDMRCLFYKAIELTLLKNQLTNVKLPRNLDEFFTHYREVEGDLSVSNLNNLMEELFYQFIVKHSDFSFYKTIEEIVIDIFSGDGDFNGNKEEFSISINRLFCLDREFSGLFIFSKNQKSYSLSDNFFVKRKISGETIKVFNFEKAVAAMEFIKNNNFHDFYYQPHKLFNICVKLRQEVNQLKKEKWLDELEFQIKSTQSEIVECGKLFDTVVSPTATPIVPTTPNLKSYKYSGLFSKEPDQQLKAAETKVAWCVQDKAWKKKVMEFKEKGLPNKKAKLT